jgi:DNA-directed RNA polymerase specialized sigma24 family protein
MRPGGRNRHDAEDAFQATFLILVRKAASIGSRELIANWLYGVAYNTRAEASPLMNSLRSAAVASHQARTSHQVAARYLTHTFLATDLSAGRFETAASLEGSARAGGRRLRARNLTSSAGHA